VDRNRIRHPGLLRFNESLRRLEDYDFVLRLAYYYEPLLIPAITNIYCVRKDSSNSNVNLCNQVGAFSPEKSRQEKTEWAKALESIQSLKKKIFLKAPV
jgi:hypothetical protein